MKLKIPQHVAIVMDGNGRWAAQRGLPRVEGHRVGVNTVKEVIKCCLQHEIKVLSLFAFSSENWSRPEMEVDFLMQLFLTALSAEMIELHKNGIRIQFTGDRERLSLPLRTQMQEAEKLTVNNQALVLNVVVNYGGKWDIIQATKILVNQVIDKEITVEDINEQIFAQALNTYPLPDPDLFIRTSGEQRISNFFLWQLSFTELYFSEVYWPDFNTSEFEKALVAFNSRERRFGQTSQQLDKEHYV